MVGGEEGGGVVGEDRAESISHRVYLNIFHVDIMAGIYMYIYGMLYYIVFLLTASRFYAHAFANLNDRTLKLICGGKKKRKNSRQVPLFVPLSPRLHGTFLRTGIYVYAQQTTLA